MDDVKIECKLAEELSATHTWAWAEQAYKISDNYELIMLTKFHINND